MDSKKFWQMLSESNKIKVEEMLDGYAGSDGIIGRIFELYEEGANGINCTVDEYLKEISPNKYVQCLYEEFNYRNEV